VIHFFSFSTAFDWHHYLLSYTIIMQLYSANVDEGLLVYN